MIWYIKQLLPLRYETTCSLKEDGRWVRKRCVWRMWFGRCFDVHWSDA